MKKKYVVIFSVLIIVSVLIYICIPKTKEEAEDKAKTNVNTNGFLTLMLEQDDGSYQKSTSNTWPGDGYAFNSELSGCERGGELVYDKETNIVKLISSGSDKCYVYFDKYINSIVNSIIVISKTNDTISISVSASGGTNSVATYYYSKDNGSSYVSSTSNTYTFTGLNSGTTYKIKVFVKDTNGVSSSVKTINVETESAVLLADYIKGLYTSQGSNGIYYHTSSLANSAGDNSYRYAGANPNNYVCFGSDANICPSDNLYRIIGVFGSEVKLIKYDYILQPIIESSSNCMYSYTEGAYGLDGYSNSYKGNLNQDNIPWCYWYSYRGKWQDSPLIKENLNVNFLNTFDNYWQNFIVDYDWVFSAISSRDLPVKQIYNNENDNKIEVNIKTKIGLMYVSDYGYAVSPEYWTININSYSDIASLNWIYMGLREWTLTGYWSCCSTITSIEENGGLSYAPGDYLEYFSTYDTIRPVFYLNSDVKYISGSGTSSDPIRIN